MENNMNDEITCVEEMIGQTIIEVSKPTYYDNGSIEFTLESGFVCRLFHNQNCCESVRIEEIHGDLAHLVGSPLLMAEEASDWNFTDGGKEEWTFYKFATIKGYVTIRWYGSSNGYYSTSVDFECDKIRKGN